MNRRQTFLVATLVGLSYIPVLYWICPRLAGFVGLSAAIPFRGALTITTLAIGLSVCFCSVPLCTSGTVRSYSRSLREAGFSVNARVIAFVGGAIGTTVALASAVGMPPLLFTQQVRGYFGATAFTALAAVQPAIVEEFLLRGIVLGLLLRFERWWVAVLWSSGIFGLWHFPQGGGAVLSIGLVSIFLFAVPRVLTASIFPGAVAHLLTNANVVLPTIWGYVVVSGITVLLFAIRARKQGSA